MPLASAPFPAFENLIVEVDVLNIERDVLLGLPVNGLRQLGLRHDRQADLLDDDGVAGERGGNFLGLERLVAEQTADGVGDGAAVDDRAVDDAVGRDWLEAERDDLVALARRLELDRLDRARPDVEADDRLVFTEPNIDV